jgi:hypothetical protein
VESLAKRGKSDSKVPVALCVTEKHEVVSKREGFKFKFKFSIRVLFKL